jgi:hypothetical protein
MTVPDYHRHTLIGALVGGLRVQMTAIITIKLMIMNPTRWPVTIMPDLSEH